MATFSSAIRAARPGLTAVAQALGGGAYEQARDKEVLLQSRLAQALAQQQASAASADLNAAKADSERAGLAAQSPEALTRNAMLINGVPLDAEPEVSSFLRSGSLGSKYEAPADGVGPTLQAPSWAGPGPELPGLGPSKVTNPGQLGNIARAIGGIQNAIAIGDKNSENIAKAEMLRRQMGLGDEILSGTRSAADVGRSQAAIEGKALYDNIGDTGQGFDLFAGTQQTLSPILAGRYGRKTDAQVAADQARAKASTASAASSYASADASKALAAQRRQITANGPGPGRVPVGYRYTTGADGEARLEPIPGGPKDPNAQTGKPLPASAAKGYLENVDALRQVENALQLIAGSDVGEMQGDADATGLKGYLPNMLLSRVDPKGVAARAAIADIGSLKIHDRSGAAVTAAEFPRLAPFIPSATDTPETVAKKLRQFEHNYRALVEDTEEFYRASGYNLPAVQARRDSPSAPNPGPTSPRQALGKPPAAVGWGIVKE